MFTKNFALLRQRVKEHVEADSIIQGDYWDSVTMSGCFIGCLARFNYSSAARIYNEETYGLPISLQRIAENIFESLPLDEAKNFFASLPEAIGQDGKDLTNIHWKFLASELRNIPQQALDLQTIIDQVIDGLDLLIQGMQWTDAGEIAEAAEAAANSAVWCAAAEAAWAVAEAAAGTDWDAAWAAADAADRAAADRAAARLRQRDSLLRLIKEAPVKPV